MLGCDSLMKEAIKKTQNLERSSLRFENLLGILALVIGGLLSPAYWTKTVSLA